jgi:hypothetical protein
MKISIITIIALLCLAFSSTNCLKRVKTKNNEVLAAIDAFTNVKNSNPPATLLSAVNLVLQVLKKDMVLSDMYAEILKHKAYDTQPGKVNNAQVTKAGEITDKVLLYSYENRGLKRIAGYINILMSEFGTKFKDGNCPSSNVEKFGTYSIDLGSKMFNDAQASFLEMKNYHYLAPAEIKLKLTNWSKIQAEVDAINGQAIIIGQMNACFKKYDANSTLVIAAIK